MYIPNALSIAPDPELLPGHAAEATDDEAAEHRHLCSLELTRWAIKNRLTKQSVDELLDLGQKYDDFLGNVSCRAETQDACKHAPCPTSQNLPCPALHLRTSAVWLSELQQQEAQLREKNSSELRPG